VEESVDEGGLPDPAIAGDEDDLARAAGGGREPMPQLREVGVAPGCASASGAASAAIQR